MVWATKCFSFALPSVSMEATSFSTFSAELDLLMREGRGGPALLYALSSVCLGVLAAVGGRLLGGRL